MKRMKRIFTSLFIVAIITTIGTISVGAEQVEPGNNITINDDGGEFSELLFVNNGKTYVPVRLAFPTLNDKENKIGFATSWGTAYPVIHLIYGNTTGDDASGGILPFLGQRRCIDIMWEGDAYQGANASISVIDYSEVANGVPVNPEVNDEYSLNDPIILRNVDGGNRMFISIDDVNRLVDILGLDNAYSVKLYK